MLPKGIYVHLSCDESEKPRVTSCSHCGREKLRWIHSVMHQESGDIRPVGSECAKLLTTDSDVIDKEEKRERARSRRNHKNSIEYSFSKLDLDMLAIGINPY